MESVKLRAIGQFLAGGMGLRAGFQLKIKKWQKIEGIYVHLEIQPVHPKGNQSLEVSHIHCKDWCWGWSSNTLATWCEELINWKRPWCWERLKAGEGDNRGWAGWMASLTWWTWVWASSRSWWWTGKTGVLQSMGSKRVGHDWVNGTDMYTYSWFTVLYSRK